MSVTSYKDAICHGLQINVPVTKTKSSNLVSESNQLSSNTDINTKNNIKIDYKKLQLALTLLPEHTILPLPKSSKITVLHHNNGHHQHHQRSGKKQNGKFFRQDKLCKILQRAEYENNLVDEIDEYSETDEHSEFDELNEIDDYIQQQRKYDFANEWFCGSHMPDSDEDGPWSSWQF